MCPGLSSTPLNPFKRGVRSEPRGTPHRQPLALTHCPLPSSGLLPKVRRRMTAGRDTNVSLWVCLWVRVLAAGCVHSCVCEHAAIFIWRHCIFACYIVQLHLCLSVCVSLAPGQRQYGRRSPSAFCQEPLALRSFSWAGVCTPTYTARTHWGRRKLGLPMITISKKQKKYNPCEDSRTLGSFFHFVFHPTLYLPCPTYHGAVKYLVFYVLTYVFFETSK